jgi:hypothetical protein
MDIRVLKKVAATYARCSSAALVDQMVRRLHVEPRCPIAHYLLACHCFERGRCAQAVRHMMTAHHAEPALESAALLVFAGLNWVSRRGTPLLVVLLDTWVEFRRPEFDRRRKERCLLDAFAQPLGASNAVSALARRLWRLPVRTLRAQISEAVLSPDAGQYPLLLAPS